MRTCLGPVFAQTHVIGNNFVHWMKLVHDVRDDGHHLE